MLRVRKDELSQGEIEMTVWNKQGRILGQFLIGATMLVNPLATPTLIARGTQTTVPSQPCKSNLGRWGRTAPWRSLHTNQLKRETWPRLPHCAEFSTVPGTMAKWLLP